jgi:hypothetical protein
MLLVKSAVALIPDPLLGVRPNVTLFMLWR